MRKQKIYLETTLFNYYLDADRGFPHHCTVALFDEIAQGKYEAFTSRYVVDELDAAPDAKSRQMTSIILERNIPVLHHSDEAARLAELYIEAGVIPRKYGTDGLHIAIATVSDLDMIVSMNFRHIVKRKTKTGAAHIGAMNGYRAIEICSPMEVVDNEND